MYMDNTDTKVVILCGGMGTRLREETEFKPKPLVEIGGRPILWHIMKTYAHYGFNQFVLCLGYKGDMIKNYFLNYELMNSDVTLELGNKSMEFHNSPEEEGWRITLANTGTKALTGARVKRIEKYIDEDQFMLTYGDGVSNVDVDKLFNFHLSHPKIGTVTGVRPSSRFGELLIEDNKVKQFSEKPQIEEGFINGGYFVYENQFFDYLEEKDECDLERAPLEKLASDGELMVYKHDQFWHCMDTYRDTMLLNELWNINPEWKIWKD